MRNGQGRLRMLSGSPRRWLRRSKRGLWYCPRDIPPERIRGVVTFGVLACSLVDDAAAAALATPQDREGATALGEPVRLAGGFFVGVRLGGRIGLLETRAPDFCAEFGRETAPILQWAQRIAAVREVSGVAVKEAGQRLASGVGNGWSRRLRDADRITVVSARERALTRCLWRASVPEEEVRHVGTDPSK